MKTPLLRRELPVTERGEEGFTLVELLVAIALFGLVLVALTGVLISSTRSIGDQRLRTAATRVATDHLETLRTLPFDQLDGQTGSTTRTTPDGRAFVIDTAITAIDPGTGVATAGGRVKQITAVVTWTSRGTTKAVSYSTAVAAGTEAVGEQQRIGTVIMFPSPTTTDASGRPLEDIEATVPLSGFPATALVLLSWTNADGTAGAKTLTSTTGLNWRGTIAKEQVRAALRADGGGEVQFTVSVGSLTTVYSLAVQKVVASPPAITSSAIDRSPITVVLPAPGRTCSATNQCQNTTDVVFTATVSGLDPAQDSVVLQYQLRDLTFVEVPLAPVSGATGQWRLTVRQRTTKFLAGTSRVFRFTAIRSADGAITTSTVRRDVVST